MKRTFFWHSFKNRLALAYSHSEPVDYLVTWVYEEGKFVPSAKIIEDNKYSIINDYIGRPVQSYDDKGNLVWESDYDIYGNLRNLKGDRGFIPFRQLGQYADVETDLYYNRFRYYNPDTGTYLSQDPIRLAGGNAFYAYVHDCNSWIDPFGLAECTLTFRHKTKPGKTTNLKELKRQIREQIKAMNKIR